MAPQFATKTEMIEFFRDLPKSTPYTSMLFRDFGYDAPEDAPDWQTEYFWKYLVQGQQQGLYGDELEKYAFDGTMKMKTDFRVDVVRDDAGVPIANKVSGPVKVRMTTPKMVTGTIVFNDHFKKFDGYFDGKVVSRAGSIGKVKECLTARYKVSSFIEA